jgi:putative transposase
MESKRWKRGNTCIYNMGFHIIWTPKYRKKILTEKFKDIVEKSIFDKAKELEITIEEYEIMPDHIHLFIKCKTSHNISNIVKHLKGYSSFKLREEYPYYRTYKGLWSPSYYCESIGHISENTIKRYIEEQWLHKEK